MAFDFGKITEKLKDVQELAKNLPIDKIFSDDFMAKNTKFKTITDFLSKAGITPDALKGMLNSGGDAKMDKFVSENTNFDDAKEMFQKALSFVKK